MKKIIVFAFSSAVLLLVSCSNNTQAWSKEDKKEFSDSCVKGALAAIGDAKAKTYCNCLLEKAMANYKSPKAIEKVTMGEMAQMAQECAKK